MFESHNGRFIKRAVSEIYMKRTSIFNDLLAKCKACLRVVKGNFHHRLLTCGELCFAHIISGNEGLRVAVFLGSIFD
jgi:hypothetical protein